MKRLETLANNPHQEDKLIVPRFINKFRKTVVFSQSPEIKRISPELKEHVELHESKQKDYSNLDLSANLGNILKPSAPDFGYEDSLTFDESHKRKTVGWGRFLDLVSRYPTNCKMFNFVKEAKEIAKFYETLNEGVIFEGIKPISIL